MLFIGPAGYPPGSADVVDAVRRTHDLGLNALEVQFVRNVQMAEDKAHDARILAERLGVRLSAHAPYYISLNSPSGETVAKSREWILRAARAAHALGAWIVVVHAASYSGSSSAAVTDKVVKELTKCREVLDMERNPVVIGLETMGKKGQWGTLGEIQEVMGRVEGVQPVVDFAHIHARSGGSLRGEEDFQAVFERYDAPPHRPHSLPFQRHRVHRSGGEEPSAPVIEIPGLRSTTKYSQQAKRGHHFDMRDARSDRGCWHHARAPHLNKFLDIVKNRYADNQP